MIHLKETSFFRALLRGLAFPTAVFIVHILTISLYEVWWPYDIPMHFLGGVSIAVGGAVFLASFPKTALPADVPRWFMVVFLAGLTMTVGVLWEFAEFGSDWFFHTVNQQGIRDTMGDLAMDLVGGIVGALLGARRR